MCSFHLGLIPFAAQLWRSPQGSEVNYCGSHSLCDPVLGRDFLRITSQSSWQNNWLICLAAFSVILWYIYSHALPSAMFHLLWFKLTRLCSVSWGFGTTRFTMLPDLRRRRSPLYEKGLIWKAQKNLSGSAGSCTQSEPEAWVSVAHPAIMLTTVLFHLIIAWCYEQPGSWRHFPMECALKYLVVDVLYILFFNLLTYLGLWM